MWLRKDSQKAILTFSSSPAFQHKNIYLIEQNILEIINLISKASSFTLTLDLKREDDSIFFFFRKA